MTIEQIIEIVKVTKALGAKRITISSDGAISIEWFEDSVVSMEQQTTEVAPGNPVPEPPGVWPDTTPIPIYPDPLKPYIAPEKPILPPQVVMYGAGFPTDWTGSLTQADGDSDKSGCKKDF
jgi:hypothetical protein